MPTINSLFSHQVSVIMGDYLYSRAVIELVRLDDLEPLRVMSRVTNEMTVGEMRQLLAHEPLEFSEEAYDLLIQAKTASLLAGPARSARFGPPPASAPRSAATAKRSAWRSRSWTTCSTTSAIPSVTGKPTGSDLREHKVTLPLIAALPRMDGAARKQVDALMDSPEPDDSQIAEVVAAVAEAGGLDYARERALRLAQQADGELDALPPSPARDALRAAITYVVDRRR